MEYQTVWMEKENKKVSMMLAGTINQFLDPKKKGNHLKQNSKSKTIAGGGRWVGLFECFSISRDDFEFDNSWLSAELIKRGWVARRFF